MKLAHQLLFSALAASVVCATATAKGTILIDNWHATGAHGASFPVTVDLATLYGSSLPSGSLTLDSGGSGPYLVATALSGQPENDGTTMHHYTEFVLGTLATSTEQVLFDPIAGSTSEFKLDFNYGDGGPSAPASVTLNGKTYTDAHPVTSTTLDFINDILQPGSGFSAATGGGGGGGGHGSMSAPEIDPASATSALTLLAGGVAIMLSGRRRKASQPAI